MHNPTSYWIIGIVAVSLATGCERYSEPVPAASGDSPAPATSSPAAPGGGSIVDAAADRAKVNLNSATREQFLALPGVTERMAHEFDEYRPYASIRQFRREIGKYVDSDQVAAYEKFVFVPIRANESDAETLQQIPGVDAAKAATIIAGRPYASTDAFLTALAPHVGKDAVEIARSYVAK